MTTKRTLLRCQQTRKLQWLKLGGRLLVMYLCTMMKSSYRVSPMAICGLRYNRREALGRMYLPSITIHVCHHLINTWPFTIGYGPSFKADAVIHVGTHGSLEWLPGKGAGLSASCYPELVFPRYLIFILIGRLLLVRAYRLNGVALLA